MGLRHPVARSQPTAARDRVALRPSVRSWLRPAGCCRGLTDAGSVWGQLLELGPGSPCPPMCTQAPSVSRAPSSPPWVTVAKFQTELLPARGSG